MARLFQVKQLEARKAALAAESEIYRQTLKLEVQNLRLHSLQTKRRFAALASHPLLDLLSLVAPLLGARFGGRFSDARPLRWLRLATTLFAGWRAWRRLTPLLHGLFGRTTTEQGGAPREEKSPVPNL
jgi:hypothetical protein